MKPIRKVLIANRGEIAMRVMRTAKARGVATVAVYSDADENALHVRSADEAMRIGGPAPSDSYLRIETIIAAAKRAGADAIHPGYGFLSERADFATACTQAGIVFIGPPAAAISAMGDKAEAKRRMIAAGVPCVPGYEGEDQSDAALAAAAQRVGFPLMVKASAGGGGRGIRLVAGDKDLKGALASARKEAESAFGDGRLLLEKAVVGARHVEIQILADSHGDIIHLAERDCSLQRRRQKVIEEAPSPVITADLRSAMGAAAVEAARAVGYVNAGTVEFLFDPATKEYYFLEMNTRLQVEHPVTEMIAGLDLVALQFDVAEGKPLTVLQHDVRLTGWAIEARLYAEDPSAGFLPQTGRIAALEFPQGVRVDPGVEAGDSITAHYDPMIAKLIAHGATRDEARARLAGALDATALLGVRTNAAFLARLLREAAFANGEADTSFIEDNLERLAPPEPPVSALEVALAVACLCEWPLDDPLAGWNSRGEAAFPVIFLCGDEKIEARVSVSRDCVRAVYQDESVSVEIIAIDGNIIRYRHDGCTGRAWRHIDRDGVEIHAYGSMRRFIDATYAPADAAGAGGDVVRSPMAGLVTAIAVAPGDVVGKGQTLATIEAMKMEHRLAAPRDGVVSTIHAGAGEQVTIRAPLVTLESLT